MIDQLEEWAVCIDRIAPLTLREGTNPITAKREGSIKWIAVEEANKLTDLLREAAKLLRKQSEMLEKRDLESKSDAIGD